MGVAVGNINAFMSHPVSDCQGRKAHVNEQRNVGVPQVVYSDPLYPGLFRTPVHLPVEVGFCHRENAVGGLHPIQALDIVSHFFTEESGHLNDPVALRGLGVGNHILALNPLVGLGDGDGLFLKVEVARSEGQQLCFCQYKSKKNLLLIRKKHHCFHPVMLLRTILFRLCFFFFVENVIHLPAYLHTTWFINKDFLNNL